jgi:hypothetical protein
MAKSKPFSCATGGRLVKHACYYWFLLADSHLTRRLFEYGAADRGAEVSGKLTSGLKVSKSNG